MVFCIEIAITDSTVARSSCGVEHMVEYSIHINMDLLSSEIYIIDHSHVFFLLLTQGLSLYTKHAVSTEMFAFENDQALIRKNLFKI